MPITNTVFDCMLATRRLAEAQTVAELEGVWVAAQQSFQDSWKRKGHKVLFLIHDMYSEISDDDVADIVGTINLLKKRQPLDIILHTHGGSASATDQIADVLVKRSNTAAFVPFFARSGGTLIALAMQEIYLGKGAALGPIDLQLGDLSARDIVQLARELGDSAPPHVRLAAKEAEKALRDETKKVCGLINRRHKGFLGWRGCSLAKTLTCGEMYHGESIKYRQAKHLHINVYQKIQKSVYGLISIRREQLRRLRELESQINLVQRQVNLVQRQATQKTF